MSREKLRSPITEGRCLFCYQNVREKRRRVGVKKQLKSTSVGTFVNATMRSIRSSAALLALILLTSSAAAFSPTALQRSANNAAKCTPNKHSQVDKVKVASSSSVSAALASSNAKVKASSFTALSASSSSDEDKFSFAQRIESLKCAVVGAVSGSLCLAPFAAYHDLLYSDALSVNGLAQWEFDTDMGALEGALFAIVYRYVIREDDNPMLNQGCLGAFVLIRTLSRITTPTSCSALPLSCGAPLGYVNWDMINQGLLSGVESAALFGGAALAMEVAFDKGFIGKFR